jgi:hypothetical protein
MSDRTTRFALLALLVASMAVRVALVRRGGQYYWPDENVYEQSQEIVKAIAAGHLDVVTDRLGRAGPLLFKVFGLAPAAIEYRFGENVLVPSLLFATFSVCNIWLLGRIARALGAGAVEALLASTLLALSASHFYFARHLLPYDVSMTVALLAIDVGIRSQSVRGSFLCGSLAACTVLTYNGYWTMAGCAVVIHLSRLSSSWRDAVRRGLVCAAGGIAVVGVVFAADAVLLGGALRHSYPAFVSAINQGSFEEGWRLPFEYLWHAEHGLLVVWMVSVVFCIATWRRGIASPRVQVGLIGVIGVFGALAISSTLLHAFVVYGRLARQLVPFLCLIAADMFARVSAAPSRAIRVLTPATIALLIAQAVVNFSEPLKQVFPDDLERRFGPSHLSKLTWVNVEHIYPGPRTIVLPDDYVLVFQAPHPLQFLPYQYEGYTPQQRAVLRSTDIRMRLIGPVPGS